MEAKSEFKDRLKLLRGKTKTSTRQLSLTLDKSESAIRMWEIGRAKPDADTLLILAEHFGVSTNYLLGLSKNPNEKPNKNLKRILAESKYKEDSPEVRAIQDDFQFQGFVFDLIKALNKNRDIGREIGEADLYNLFQILLKDDDPNVYRIWGHQLIHIGLIVSGIFRLNKLDERSNELRNMLGDEQATKIENEHDVSKPPISGTEQLIAQLSGLIGAAKHRNHVYEEATKKPKRSKK